MKVKKALLVIGVLMGCAMLTRGASGSSVYDSNLTYQYETTVQFNLNPSNTLTVSANELALTLMPGTYGYSETITVSMTTTNASGATVSANAGVSGGSNALTRTGGGSFSSLGVNSLVSLSSAQFPEDYWGYTLGGGTSSYSGLPSAASLVMKELYTLGTSGSGSFTFRIGAKASSAKIAGDYVGAVNFVMTTSPMPYLQNMSGSACTTTADSAYDSRDGEYYAFQRLADGNCWMLENLRLDAATLAVALNPTNTNMPDGKIFDLPDSTSNWPLSSSTASRKIPRVNTSNKNETGSGSYKYGVYYNYCAASANTYCFAEGDGSYGDAGYDICPAGWRMAGSDEYETLLGEYNDDGETFMNALRLPFSGIYETREESATSTGTNGFIWTKTYNDYTTMKALSYISSHLVTTNNTSSRNYGNTVRCIMKTS